MPVSGRSGGLRGRGGGAPHSSRDDDAVAAPGVRARRGDAGGLRRGEGGLRGVPGGARGRRLARRAAGARLRARVPRGVHRGVVPRELDLPTLPRRGAERWRRGSTTALQQRMIPSRLSVCHGNVVCEYDFIFIDFSSRVVCHLTHPFWPFCEAN